MESEEENNSDSIEVQLVKFDYEKFSIIGGSHSSSNNDEQRETGKSKKKEATVTITD